MVHTIQTKKSLVKLRRELMDEINFSMIATEKDKDKLGKYVDALNEILKEDE